MPDWDYGLACFSKIGSLENPEKSYDMFRSCAIVNSRGRMTRVDARVVNGGGL